MRISFHSWLLRFDLALGPEEEAAVEEEVEEEAAEEKSEQADYYPLMGGAYDASPTAVPGEDAPVEWEEEEDRTRPRRTPHSIGFAPRVKGK